MHPCAHSNTLYSSRTWRQPKSASTDGRMSKRQQTHHGISLSCNEQNSATCSNTDGPGDYIPRKVSHKEKVLTLFNSMKIERGEKAAE